MVFQVTVQLVSFFVRMLDILGKYRWRNGVPLECYKAEAIDAATVALGGWHGISVAAVSGELCPSSVINGIAVENPYGSLLAQLGGQCVRVTSIINDPSADPHEFQTDVQVGKAYQTAELVVQNGLGYDEFSNKIIATLAQKPVVLTGGDVVGLKPGDNPHLWYSPDYVTRISQAITRTLRQLRCLRQRISIPGPGAAAARPYLR
jgi:zinc/manganese transport system substrate-binding protein